MTYLFLRRSQSIILRIRSETPKSLYIVNSAFMVLPSSLSVWDLKLYLMSLATSSHSKPIYLASSNALLFCKSYRSCFENPCSSSSVAYEDECRDFLSRSCCWSLYYFLILSNYYLCLVNYRVRWG